MSLPHAIIACLRTAVLTWLLCIRVSLQFTGLTLPVLADVATDAKRVFIGSIHRDKIIAFISKKQSGD